MFEREVIMEEIAYRMSNVTGVSFTARNPKTPPNADDLPAILIFEFPDEVESRGSMGGHPIYKRRFKVVIECYLTASSEGAASTELGEFVEQIKKQIYTGGVNLNRKAAEIYESECSRVLRPPIGDNTVGLGLVFEVRYIEDIANLFT